MQKKKKKKHLEEYVSLSFSFKVTVAAVMLIYEDTKMSVIFCLFSKIIRSNTEVWNLI